MDSNGSMDRRKFVALLAAGAAAAAAVPIAVAEATQTRERQPPPATQPARRPMTAAVRKELETQKKSVADMLRVIRGYELPAGSPPATVFRALKARRPR